MRKLVVFIALICILIVLNFVIYKKEKHLIEGKSILLKLAPVDPRSLMQGDYMALRFGIAQKIRVSLPQTKSSYSWRRDVVGDDGFVIVNVDKDNVATFEAIYTSQTLNENQTLLQYRIRGGKVKFASNAFFFQEGTAGVYEKAKYGEFKVNDNHELLLVNMYDDKLVKLQASAKDNNKDIL